MTRPVGRLGALLALAVVGMALTGRPPEEGLLWRAPFVACLLLACGAHAVLLRRVLRGGARVRLRHVLLGAVLLRAVVLPLPPALSDDGYRYLWDGLVALRSDFSPYALLPSDSRLAGLREEGQFDRLNSPHYHSVYPPVSQAAFLAAARLADRTGWHTGWLGLKLLLVSAELAGVLLVGRVVPARWLLVYAWHPLAVLEVAGQGHTEGLLIGALGILVWALWREGVRPGRRALAGAALAAGTGVKLYPLLVLPLLTRHLGRGGTVAALLLTALVLSPLAPYAAEVWSSLALYGGTFAFYALPHAALKQALWPALGEAAASAASVLLGGGWVLALVGVALVGDGSHRALGASLAVVMIGQVVFGSVLHPWYLLPALFVLPLLQKCDSTCSLSWLAGGASATYLFYTFPPVLAHPFMWATMLVGWGGALAALSPAALQVVLRARARKKWDLIARRGFRPRPHHRVLDLGCGEGYVAAACAEATGASATLADVADFNRTRRPLVLLDPAKPLPFEGSAFDAVMLVFVLHHAQDPEHVLAEAFRVSHGPVLIWESVPRGLRHKRLLEATDRLLNRLRSPRFRDMEPHLDMRTAAHWRRAIVSAGGHIAVECCFGVFHRQAIYVAFPLAPSHRS